MSATLRKTIPHEVEIRLTGEEVADLFWNMDEKEQSAFFNRLGRFSGLPMQLQYVTDCSHLDQHGRHAMTRIGEYGTTTAETP